MSRAARPVALAAVLALAWPAGRAAAQDLATLFPLEADVRTGAPGLARLELPAEVLERSAPDLSDVRLFDAAGNEVPYVVDPGLPSGRERLERVVADAVVTDLEREETPREGGRATTRETYRVALPATSPPGGSWTLVVTSAQPRWVRSVEVLGVARDGTTVPLVPRASLVRLGQRLVDRDRVALPPFEGEEIVVAISGEEGFFLEPVLRFEADRALAASDAIERPLEILSQRSGNGRTVLEVERPPGLVAGRLRIESATPAFDRAVEVSDVAADGKTRRLGRGRILRAPALGAGAALAEQLDVVIEPARRPHLRVEITDGDSPPLEEIRVSALASAPAILFALPDGPAEEPAGVLRFGGRRAYLPRYDVADLLRDALAASGEVLDDAARIPAATLGPVRPNPRFDPAPALAPIMHPGMVVDPNDWRWHRSVEIPPSPEGLVTVHLAALDLLYARPSGADLRLVDAQHRQWPFLVAPGGERESVALEMSGPEVEDGRSRWRLVPATGPLALDRLVIHTARPALGRPFRILTTVDGEERVLATGVLAQDLRRRAPATLSFPPLRVDALVLEVEDGDDAPLAITRVEAPVAPPRLLVAAPAGSYLLLAGNPDAAAPRYEIERARDLVAGLRSVPATLGEGRENPSWRGTPGGTARLRERLTRGAIWTAIVLAVLILGALTLRAARGPAPHR